ncbi:MAG: lysophospholipid acyltransferase family protein [Thermoanaerobaculia bacterium]
MRPPEPIVSRLGSAFFPVWFPFFRWLSVRMDPDWIARLADITIERAIWGRESVRDAILENHAHVLGRPVTDGRVEASAREMISRHSRQWIDLLRYSGRPDIDPHTLVSEHIGEEELLAAQRAGVGGILLTAHVGNFELGGLFLRELGLDLFAVYVPDPSPAVERHRAFARAELGVKGIAVTSSPFAFLPMLRALKQNSFLAMQGDRDFSGTGRPLPFFGETARFPIGPFRLAQTSGAPLFPVFVLQDSDGLYRTVVEPPIRLGNLGTEAEKEAALTAAMQHFVAILTRTIRQDPTQWYLFTRFFS